jgi:hypothetical protein
VESNPAWLVMAELLSTEGMSRAFASDLAAKEPQAHEIDVLLQVTWPEVGRAARILERLDRELRRASGAWQAAYEGSSQARDETVFIHPERFSRELRQFPEPASTSRGHLRLLDSAVSPLTLLTEPVLEVWAVLDQWPASALTFALAAFGCNVHVTRWPEGRLESVLYAEPPARRHHYQQLISGHWQGSDSGPSESFTVAVPKASLFRSVARHRDESGASHGEISVLQVRHLDGDRHDCILLRAVMPE